MNVQLIKCNWRLWLGAGFPSSIIYPTTFPKISSLVNGPCAPGFPIQDGNKVVINLSTKDVEKTKQIFGELQRDGKVAAPLEEVPFSPAFGTVTDKFGVTREAFYTEKILLLLK